MPRRPVHAGHLFIPAVVAAISTAPTVAIPEARAAVCPQSEMQIGGSPFYSAAAAFDSTAFGGNYRVAYDLVSGMVLFARPGSLGVTYVRARDAYDVTGVAPGTPVTLTAELVVDAAIYTNGCGGSGCDGTVGYSIRSGQSYEEQTFHAYIYNAERREFHGTVRLPITIVAGQPQEIEFQLLGTRANGGSHGTEGTGRIQFTDLDSGVGVVSCQGFSGTLVPVRGSSWGSLKVHYR